MSLMSESGTALAAELIATYLATDNGGPTAAQFADGSPLTRSVSFKPLNWLNWLSLSPPDGKAAMKMSVPTHSDVQRLGWARDVVGELSSQNDEHRVTRAELLRYSSRLDAADQQSQIVAWVATIIWGSGNGYKRGPWRLRQSLVDDRLPGTLSNTTQLSLDDRLSDAFGEFDIDGIGPSFLTKWLWVSTLAAEPLRRPLILDVRVMVTLALLHPMKRRWPVGPDAYSEYVDSFHAIADRLGSKFPGADAEKIEWLCFNRDSQDSKLCLRDWLKSPGTVSG